MPCVWQGWQTDNTWDHPLDLALLSQDLGLGTPGTCPQTVVSHPGQLCRILDPLVLSGCPAPVQHNESRHCHTHQAHTVVMHPLCVKCLSMSV